jgi:hypothetical protein
VVKGKDGRTRIVDNDDMFFAMQKPKKRERRKKASYF